MTKEQVKQWLDEHEQSEMWLPKHPDGCDCTRHRLGTVLSYLFSLMEHFQAPMEEESGND